MQNSIHNHLGKWIFHFIKRHERLDKHNAIWLSMPAYHNLTPKTKSYRKVSQWNGKAMKDMSQYVCGAVSQSLRGGSPAQHLIISRAIECTRALLESYMCVQYQSHNEATLIYMQDTLCLFHTIKDVFSLRQAGNKAKAKSNAMRTDLVKKRKVDNETNADSWMLSRKRHTMNTWQDFISHKVDVSKKLDAEFNFLKIHLMFNWVEQIHWYRAFQQFSTKRHEQAHKTNLKEGWNASNHNLNYMPQVITTQFWILCFKIRELNLQALAQYRENSATTCNVLPSGADLAAPLSSQSYTKPKFIGL